MWILFAAYCFAAQRAPLPLSVAGGSSSSETSFLQNVWYRAVNTYPDQRSLTEFCHSIPNTDSDKKAGFILAFVISKYKNPSIKKLAKSYSFYSWSSSWGLGHLQAYVHTLPRPNPHEHRLLLPSFLKPGTQWDHVVFLDQLLTLSLKLVPIQTSLWRAGTKTNSK